MHELAKAFAGGTEGEAFQAFQHAAAMFAGVDAHRKSEFKSRKLKS